MITRNTEDFSWDTYLYLPKVQIVVSFRISVNKQGQIPAHVLEGRWERYPGGAGQGPKRDVLPRIPEQTPGQNTWKNLCILQNGKLHLQHQQPSVLCNSSKFRNIVMFMPSNSRAFQHADNFLCVNKHFHSLPSILPSGDELEVFFKNCIYQGHSLKNS